MSYNFEKLSKDILAFHTQDEFSQYLEYYYPQIEQYFDVLSEDEIQDIKFEIEDLLYDLLDHRLVLKSNPQIVNAFLILLAEKFIQSSLIGAITIIKDYIPLGVTSKRLEASISYLRVNDISKDYIARSDEILSLLENAAIEDEYSSRSIKSLFYFVYNVFYQFNRVQNSSLASEFISQLQQRTTDYTILRSELAKTFFENIKVMKLDAVIPFIKNTIASITTKKLDCSLKSTTTSIETSEYSEKLRNLPDPSFDSIRNVAYKYLQSIGDPEELFYRLQRGEKIIDDEKLLYKYLVSFGGKHKIKLYSAYDEIIDKIQNEKFNIIDWGCGQATATMVLLDYARTKNITLNIDTINLIEPSSLALSRGVLHIDLLKQTNYNINTINTDLDCLIAEAIKIDNNHKTLHLFSNILDLETFSLDTNFLQKVSSVVNTDNIFVCVSPNRNDKLNNRIEIFYKYFDENFDTSLISTRSDSIQNATRYEKIFISKPIVEPLGITKEIEATIDEKTNYQLDVIKELAMYENHITPILNMQLLEDSINIDPEYAIFKVRKVAEVITSNIYSQYEDNTKQVSFNDKIRYLSYEKKVFDKTITNYVQTIRTIGNRGVHEDDRSIAKLKLDAHLVIIALVSFLQELVEKKLIN